MTAADNETLPLCLLLAINKCFWFCRWGRDSGPLGWVYCVSSLCLSPSPCFLLSPLPPLRSGRLLLPQRAAGCLAWTRVCQGSGNAIRQLDSNLLLALCRNSISSSPWLGPTAKSPRFSQGWRGTEGQSRLAENEEKRCEARIGEGVGTRALATCGDH